MADYSTSIRSNYFHVKSEDVFLEFMKHVAADGDNIDILMNTDADGMPVFGFATHGVIIGVVDESDDGTTYGGDQYEAFLLGLQEIIDEEDAVIILEIGNSKLQDVYAGATIVTSDETDYIDLQEIASDKAIDLLYTYRC